MKKLLSIILTVSMLAAMLVIGSMTASANTPVKDFKINKATTEPRIDGEFDEADGWGNPIFAVAADQIKEFEYNGISQYVYGSLDEEITQTTFTGYAKWDETYIYTCMIVTGCYYENSRDAEELFHGSSVQVTYDGSETFSNNNEFGFAVSAAGGTMAYRFSGSNTELDDVTYVAKRNDSKDEVVYETKIPLAEINADNTVGTKIAAAFCANFGDGEFQGGYQIGAGLYYGKDNLYLSIMGEFVDEEGNPVSSDDSSVITSSDNPSSEEPPVSSDESQDPDSSDSSDTSSVSSDEPDLLYGDVDDNGEVNAQDALLTLKIAVQLVEATEDQNALADVDLNGEVNSLDALNILKYTLELITDLPVVA